MVSSSTDFSGFSGTHFNLPRSARGASRQYRYRLQAAYETPTRVSQPLLHPFKENGGLWFGIDDSVTNFIKHNWQANFWGPWKNWSDVKNKAPEKIQAWWGTFVQNYNWDPKFEDLVFYFWKEKTKTSMEKVINRKKRLNKKPKYISDRDWTILLEEWHIEKAIQKNLKPVSSRKTSIDGKEMHKHTDEPISFGKTEYKLRQKIQSSKSPSILDSVKTVHTGENGTYVNQVVEELVKEVEDAATQCKDLSDTVGSTSGPSQKVITQLYVERAKPRYGHGVDSAKMQIYQPVEGYPSHTYPSHIQEDLRGEINGIMDRMKSIEGKIDMMMETVERLLGGQGTSSKN